MDQDLRVQSRAWQAQDLGGSESQNLCLQAYRACVLSSMDSPLVSCWASASGDRMPFSVASLSERSRIRGNSRKSYSRAPIAPPIMGPTQYTWRGKSREQWRGGGSWRPRICKSSSRSYPVVDKVPDEDSRGEGPCRIHSCSSVVHLQNKRRKHFKAKMIWGAAQFIRLSLCEAEELL